MRVIWDVIYLGSVVSVGLIGNAIRNAETPVMDGLAQAEGEYVTLDASGLAVGLPAGLMGNSEVGHFTIGTGRVVFQVRRTSHAHVISQ